MVKRQLAALFAASALALGACGGNADNTQPKSEGDQAAAAPEKVEFALDWTPNTNHTGLYVAQEKGYFKEQGLDIHIIMPGEAGANPLVAAGKAQFGIGAQEQITEARAQEIPLVSIGAIIQHNTSGFASPVDKGIQKPKDFEGKTYGGWGAPVEKAVIQSMMEPEGGDVEKVKIVNLGKNDFFTAVKRDIDFAWIYYAWTGVEAEQRKLDLNMIYLKDFAKELDYYTPVIMTSEKLIREKPELAKRFMAAIAKGYQYAIEQPDDAAAILLKANPDLDADLVKASQKWLSPKYQDDASRWGFQKQEVWEGYAKWMIDHQLLDKPIDAKAAFTNEFLPPAQ